MQGVDHRPHIIDLYLHQEKDYKVRYDERSTDPVNYVLLLKNHLSLLEWKLFLDKVTFRDVKVVLSYKPLLCVVKGKLDDV